MATLAAWCGANPVLWVMATPQLVPMSWPLPHCRRVRAPRGCGLAAPLPISCRIYRGTSGSPAKFHYYTCSRLRLAVKHSSHSLLRQAGADVPSTPSWAPREALSRCLPLGAGARPGSWGQQSGDAQHLRPQSHQSAVLPWRTISRGCSPAPGPRGGAGEPLESPWNIYYCF